MNRTEEEKRLEEKRLEEERKAMIKEVNGQLKKLSMSDIYVLMKNKKEEALLKLAKEIDYKIDDESVNILYPTIYRVAVDDLHCDIIYDPKKDDKELLKYSIDSNLLNHILSIDEPITFYNSLNDAFSVIYNVHDWLGYSHTINSTFILQHNKVELITSDLYLVDNINFYTDTN